MGECHCSNIAIMQLFHELKQQFPALPDHVVSQCIAQVQVLFVRQIYRSYMLVSRKLRSRAKKGVEKEIFLSRNAIVNDRRLLGLDRVFREEFLLDCTVCLSLTSVQRDLFFSLIQVSMLKKKKKKLIIIITTNHTTHHIASILTFLHCKLTDINFFSHCTSVEPVCIQTSFVLTIWFFSNSAFKNIYIHIQRFLISKD